MARTKQPVLLRKALVQTTYRASPKKHGLRPRLPSISSLKTVEKPPTFDSGHKSWNIRGRSVVYSPYGVAIATIGTTNARTSARSSVLYPGVREIPGRHRESGGSDVRGTERGATPGRGAQADTHPRTISRFSKGFCCGLACDIQPRARQNAPRKRANTGSFFSHSSALLNPLRSQRLRITPFPHRRYPVELACA
jgi:hypothetical protein